MRARIIFFSKSFNKTRREIFQDMTSPVVYSSSRCASKSIYYAKTTTCFTDPLLHSLHKKWSFPLRISTVNVTKSAVSCGFGHIHWRNPSWKTSFFGNSRRLNAIFCAKLNLRCLNVFWIGLCYWLFVFKVFKDCPIDFILDTFLERNYTSNKTCRITPAICEVIESTVSTVENLSKALVVFHTFIAPYIVS